LPQWRLGNSAPSQGIQTLGLPNELRFERLGI